MSTAHQQAYNKIRDAIFSGEFGPGYHLKEEELTEYCQTSRTPVRQAIRSLEKEGIIIFRNNRRSYVPDLDERESEEAFDLLAFLESYSAGLAARKIDSDQIAKLKKIQHRFDALLEREQFGSRKLLEINSEFHQAIHEASGNAILQEMIQKASGLTFNLYIKYGITGDPQAASDEHWEMISALEHNDCEYTALQTRLHVESVRRVYRRFWSGDDRRTPGDKRHPSN